MSNQFHHKLRYSRYFMAPVWIALALGGMGVAFLLGGALVTDEWSRQDNEKLAEYKPGGLVVVPGASDAKADQSGGNLGTSETSPKPESLSTLVWRSPASALEWAAEGVKHERIEFAIYRNLLRAALAEQDASAHQIAFRSIRDVLQYGGAFADDLKAELKGMAPQVFITTTTSQAGIDAGVALEKELRDVGMTVVNRELDPGSNHRKQGLLLQRRHLQGRKDARSSLARQGLWGHRGGCLEPGGRQFGRHGGDPIRRQGDPCRAHGPEADPVSRGDATRVRSEATRREDRSPSREKAGPDG